MSDVLLQQISSEMKDIKTDISEIKLDVSTLKSNVSTLKANVKVLNQEMSEVKKEQQLINTRLSALESKQDAMYTQISFSTEMQSKNLSLLEQLQSDVEFTYQKIVMNDLKINRFETHSIQNTNYEKTSVSEWTYLFFPNSIRFFSSLALLLLAYSAHSIAY